MADATLQGQIIVGAGLAASYIGVFFQLKSHRTKLEEKNEARNKEIDKAILAVGEKAGEAVRILKEEVDRSLKEFQKTTSDFMPKADITRADLALRGDIDRLQLMVIDTKMVAAKNEQRIEDMESNIDKIETSISAMRNEMNQGFQRTNDSINQLVRAAK